ncbi:glycoside hydrolase family 3 N-terminal domain-containing protein [Candidatus Fukatsuia endosymbiont of Tuberolachnus salignus]|uniref:glycoside hydrolase family 3 N-terminal domain-containing protein n=1 Tax=Candidatus Fukatsuia endosymbiont of Tuberolachnus salignus TaxID=3077957 RepID=UPI00313DBD02
MILFFNGYRIAVFWTFLLFALSGCSSPSKQQGELLDETLLKEKIGQMLIVGFDGFKVETNSPIARAIQHRQLGGVILFDYDLKKKTYRRNIESPAQLKKLTAELQNLAAEADRYRANTAVSSYPLIIEVDYEGGEVNRLNSRYGFPETYSAQQFAKLPIQQKQQQTQSMAKTLVWL